MRPNVEILQAKVRDWLTDAGRVEWQDGTIRDPETGLDVPNWVERYNGPLLVQPQSSYKRVVSGGAAFTVTKYDVTLPADTPVQTEDRLTIDTSAFDAQLNGAVMTILDVSLDTWQLGRYCVAQRLADN